MARSTKKQKSDPLKSYRDKRDFKRTREPKPKVGKRGGVRFVVQKHAARRVHYDLRLEHDGVLWSWAVTRGPSLVPETKRLSVRTEDHPLKYLDFEGVIPAGEYGGGTMIVWDYGRWQSEFDPVAGLEKGHLSFFLEGERLKGQWHLVRLKQKPGERTESWLLMKAEDEFARPSGAPDILEENTTSALTGREIAEVTAAEDIRADHSARKKVAAKRRVALPDPKKVRGAKPGLLPTFVEPSLAALADRAPSGERWIHEIKFDGYRSQARIDGKEIQILTRKGLDWTKRFTGVAKTLTKLGLGSALLDGEIVVEDTAGRSSFSNLQSDLQEGRQDRLIYHVFDILYLEGVDLRAAPLIERKHLLRQVLDRLPANANVRYSDHLEDGGEAMFTHACRLGLEGIISKRRDLPHRSGRGDHWRKRKCVLGQEFVIGGFIPSTAGKGAVGSLAVGYYERGALHYAGRVGTGFSGETSRRLAKALTEFRQDDPPFKTVPKEARKGVRWVTPAMVAEVEFRAWTKDGLIRQAAFKGLREDRAPEEIRREGGEIPGKSKRSAAAGVRLTHPERLLWEKDGVTKQGFADFYTTIADWILPYVVRRPLSLLRCPTGIEQQCFFAKHPWKGLDAAIHPIDTGDGDPSLWIENLDGLLALVQASAVELHPWGATIDDLDRPDRLIFDIDPADDVAWEAVIAAAAEVRQRLRDAKLECFLKTTGGKGLHVVVPLVPKADWKAVKSFAQGLASAMAKDSPQDYLATASRSARRGRIYIDYLRNDRGSTAVAAYSTRARDGATVSTPIGWDELSPEIKGDHFNVESLPRRLDFLKTDPWRELTKIRQSLPGTARRSSPKRSRARPSRKT